MKTGWTTPLVRSPWCPGTRKILTWPHAKTPASSSVITRNRGCVSTRENEKGLRRVLIWKESLEQVPTACMRLCLHCAISWTGVARCSSVKERNLVENNRAKIYVILKKQSIIRRTGRIELYCLLLLNIPWVLNTPTGDTGVIDISPPQNNART